MVAIAGVGASALADTTATLTRTISGVKLLNPVAWFAMFHWRSGDPVLQVDQA